MASKDDAAPAAAAKEAQAWHKGIELGPEATEFEALAMPDCNPEGARAVQDGERVNMTRTR